MKHQQVRLPMRSKLKLAWLAGIIDGEGEKVDQLVFVEVGRSCRDVVRTYGRLVM